MGTHHRARYFTTDGPLVPSRHPQTAATRIWTLDILAVVHNPGRNAARRCDRMRPAFEANARSARLTDHAALKVEEAAHQGHFQSNCARRSASLSSFTRTLYRNRQGSSGKPWPTKHIIPVQTSLSTYPSQSIHSLSATSLPTRFLWNNAISKGFYNTNT